MFASMPVIMFTCLSSSYYKNMKFHLADRNDHKYYPFLWPGVWKLAASVKPIYDLFILLRVFYIYKEYLITLKKMMKS